MVLIAIQKELDHIISQMEGLMIFIIFQLHMEDYFQHTKKSLKSMNMFHPKLKIQKILKFHISIDKLYNK